MKGIDISKYQQQVQWPQVRSDGIEFAMIRASVGSYTPDPMFRSHVEGAQKAGLHTGAYHYFYATNKEEAEEEAKFFLSRIEGYSFDFPLAVDVEESSILHVGKETLTDAVIAFCEVVENAGYYISVYANPSWLRHYLQEDRLTPYDLWLAHWDVASPSRSCGMWQYTSSGTVAGIGGRVDLDESYKDYPAIIKGAGRNGFSPSSIPPKQTVGTYTGDRVYIRSAPDESGRILRSMIKGDYFAILSENCGWYEIAFSDIPCGYIPKDFVTISYR